MQLRKTGLADEQLRINFYKKVIESVNLKENYLILLGCDSYDVPFKSKDDSVQSDASDETYTYLLCAICPVKQAKANLRYVAEEKERQLVAIIQEENLKEEETRKFIEVAFRDGSVKTTGTDIDKLMTGPFELTYNVPHWKIGAEYNYTEAYYGTTQKDGKVKNTHSVGNNRLVLSATYSF